VLENNVSMGGGAKLANLRLDDGEISGTGRNKLGAMIGQGVRIGINASIMPGVKIGKNSFVGSGVILDRDLPEDSFCVAKSAYTVTKNRAQASTSREEFKKKIS
jgi:bifunctional UDP-N-acetylglucosamine pyrophosphorylase/glucosamine-1-phosphate N-acetyltransferase